MHIFDAQTSRGVLVLVLVVTVLYHMKMLTDIPELNNLCTITFWNTLVLIFLLCNLEIL